tara:strand:- start:1989 stop:2327 length:339 start_codon:yes stop_codon:yes gene_type:complete
MGNLKEVTEKSYEILTIRVQSIFHYVLPNGNFKSKSGASLISNDFVEDYPIISVKRLSDGEIFTDGDSVSFKYHMNTVFSEINNFKVKNNKISYKTNYGRRTQFSTIQHITK